MDGIIPTEPLEEIETEIMEGLKDDDIVGIGRRSSSSGSSEEDEVCDMRAGQ